ncbi:hypothetical protein OPFAMLBM_00230 [Aeromonas phage avDM12-TAAL]|nr:hypothetical protein OPFAMLBM_00230 [Aeromonas phage avDM12-TAAL]
MATHRKPEQIETTDLCKYGCGNIAKYKSVGGNLMCECSSNKCPVNIKKNSEKLKALYDSGMRKSGAELYKSLSHDIKTRMSWSKGLTKETNSELERPTLVGKRFGASLYGHTEESKRKISIARTEWLKKTENRTNLGRFKKSWMEETFESYLNENKITGWIAEKHFYSPVTKKNYYVDFLFQEKMLILELDGTQHRKSIEHDKQRDLWFNSIGYKVIRVPVDEFKRRFFSGVGFIDLL